MAESKSKKSTKDNNNEIDIQEMNAKFPKPKDICKALDEYVIGQEDAKRILSVAVYNHYKRILANIYHATPKEELSDVTIDKSNLLLCGSTGSGKTFLIKQIAKFLGLPCYIADATKLTESGYVGDDVESILVGLLQEADYDVELAQMGIVALDEIDKVGRRGDNPSITRDVGGEGVQQGLLKIVEGGVIGVPPKGGRKHPEQPLVYIDTTNILFIGLGAFDGLDKIVERRLNRKTVGFNQDLFDKNKDNEENILSQVISADLKSFGLIPELIGRFPIVTYTNELSKEDLVRILKEPKNALIKQYQKLLAIDGVDLEFKDNALEVIAEETLKLKIGARGLRNIMEKVLTNIMYDYCDKYGKKVIVDKKYVSKILKVEEQTKKAA